MKTGRKLTLAAAALLLAATACSGDEAPSGENVSQAEAGSATDLAAVCPSPWVVQTDWDPEAEYAALYHMLGEDYQDRIDTNQKRVTAALMAGDTDTGIDLEIRVGGPAIGYEQVSAQMYLDKSIHMGQVNSDSAVEFSAEQPTLSVVAPLDISPFMLMWDPEQHPDWHTISDIGQTDTTVLYFESDTYMEYLIGSGILRESQVDGSYDGTPSRWVAEGGRIAQAGFATSEPYYYEHELPAWGKGVKFALVHDTDYPIYPQALSIRAEDRDELAPCLERLVPIIQQAQVDYIRSPDETNGRILELVEQYNTGWVYSQGLADYAVETMRELGIVGNGTDGDSTLGDFDAARVQRVIDIVTPILAGQDRPVAEGLSPDDLVTNEFIDERIGLPAS